MAFGAGMGAGWVVLFELQSGVIERLRVTPASRLALLLGSVLRDVIMFLAAASLVVMVALPFGFHAHWSHRCVVQIDERPDASAIGDE